jgi:flagellar FliL protein
MATEETKPAASPASGGGKLMPIMMGVNMLLIAGVLALVLVRTGGAKAATAEKPAEKSEKSEHGEAKAEKKEGEHGEGEKKEEKKSEGEHGEKKSEGEHGEHAEKAPTAPAGAPTVKIPDFTVRLRNPEADRYARITFEMAVAAEADKTTIESRMPQLRDAFLSYLSDRTMEELRGSDGIEKTKIALMEKLPQVAPGAKVLAIYVTDMVVQ